MGSQLDLDQGGTNRQTTKVYMGPSVGWVTAPWAVILPVAVAGTTTVLLGTCLVAVNVAGLVSIQLPLAKANSAGAQAVPGSFISAPMAIIDVGGHAAATNITILPAGSELIDGLASIAISSNYGALVLQPDTVNGGWIIAS